MKEEENFLYFHSTIGVNWSRHKLSSLQKSWLNKLLKAVVAFPHCRSKVHHFWQVLQVIAEQVLQGELPLIGVDSPELDLEKGAKEEKACLAPC